MNNALSITETLRGRHVVLIGATGFLGKVVLGTLIRNVPDIGSITCLIRLGKDGRSAHDRLRSEVWETAALAPARAGLGDRAETFVAEKLIASEGDIGQPTLGLHPEAAEAIAARCDLVINVSGLVNFNPPLHWAVATNVAGAAHVAQFTAACRHAALVHISTCYVAGARSGEFAETGPLTDWCPRGAGAFDHRKEIATLQAMLQRHAPAEATAIGLQRARVLGWPNVYTYTKALGEQTVAGTPGLRFTIVRPAIIESALAFPEPGWNEGINTSAPLAFLGLLGQARYPCGDGVILDVIPVDFVANAIGMIGAALVRIEAQPVYQLGSSDANPLTMAEAIELTGLFKRRYLSTAQSQALAQGLGMPNWLRYLMAQWEAVPISAERFRRFSAPRIRAVADALLPWLAPFAKGAALPVRALAKPMAEAGKALQNLAARAEDVFTQYLPFIHDHVARFRCDHIRALVRRLPRAEQQAWRWAPEAIDWRHYWIDVHLRGLSQHVFPQMTARLQGKDGRPLLPHLSFLVPMPIPEGLKVRDLRVPKPVQAVVKAGLGQVQSWLYTRFFHTTVTGRGYIPANRNVLVVANHSSHLDMGLIKHALGAYGHGLRALAAKDYFFQDGIRRIYFGNFTNLLPVDRSADLQESLKPAFDALTRGETILMFPEGTRTLDGRMGRFKRGVGYLALTAGVDVLPIALYGTFAAIPKGRLLIPRHRAIGARLGPLLANTELQRAVTGLAPDEAYRQAAALIEQAVRVLAEEPPEAVRPDIRADDAAAQSGTGGL